MLHRFTILLALALAGVPAARQCQAARDPRELLGIPEHSEPTSWTVTTPLPIDRDTVELFIRTAPVFKRCEDDQFIIIRESHRTKIESHRRQLSLELTDVVVKAEERAGIKFSVFRDLRRHIRSIHRALYEVRRVEADLKQLLLEWDEQKAHGVAADELFTDAKDRLEADLERARNAYNYYPQNEREVIEAYDRAIVAAMKLVRDEPDRKEKKKRLTRLPEPDLVPRSNLPRPDHPLFRRFPGEFRAPPLTKEDFPGEYPLECHCHGDYSKPPD